MLRPYPNEPGPFVANFDVIILGGGPAGYVCAIRCAQLGLSTAVVEQDKLGGVCVNIGCIPTKALLHSAYIANLLKESKDFGVEASGVKTDYGVAMKRSRRVSDQNSKGVEFLMNKHKVTLDIEAGGEKKQIVAAAVLMATGRAVNTENIGLKECGIQLTDRGFIKVDKNLQTTAPGYFAIGDVAGPPMLAHKGFREGAVVAEIIAGQKPHPIKYDNVPSVTYCHPEVASIGLTEDQCKEKKLDYVAGKFPFSANGRARGTGETEGFVKILRDKKYGEILGAHIVGAHASEMIHELAVARENEYTVEEIDLAIHAHPTMSEAIGEAALDSLGRVLHI